MKNEFLSITLAAAILLMSGCVGNTETSVTETSTETVTEISAEEAVEIIPERIYPDNAFKDVPEDYIGNENVPKGSVVRFTYDTVNHLDFNDNKETYQKSALVYLPACYDEKDTKTKYNVFYLMHGGSKPTETAERLASKVKEQGYSAEEYFIYSGCGGYDMAEPNLTPQINAMKELTDTFIYCENFADGNLYQCIYPQGGHDRKTVARILYNGLPKMFG